jgi:hypothetical protein
MTDEDLTAAKLKGKNCLIKFKDGEELLIKIDYGDEDNESEWFMDMEKFINSSDDQDYCPLPGFSMTRGTIKYVRKI